MGRGETRQTDGEGAGKLVEVDVDGEDVEKDR
jgi:N-acetylglutamate synthase/N-acetylornithine aminotransferase